MPRFHARFASRPFWALTFERAWFRSLPPSAGTHNFQPLLPLSLASFANPPVTGPSAVASPHLSHLSVRHRVHPLGAALISSPPVPRGTLPQGLTPPIFATRPPPTILMKPVLPTPLHSPPRFGPSPSRDEPAHAPSFFTSHHAVDPSDPIDTLTLSSALNPPPGAGPSARTQLLSLHPSQALLLPTSWPRFPPHQPPARATSARRPRGLPPAAPHPHVSGWAPSALPPAALSLCVPAHRRHVNPPSGPRI
ncbi:hypothetical protein V8E36_005153 [Tilletia maclaganii]